MADAVDEKAARLCVLLQQCAGFDGDEISNARALALDYYFQRPLNGDDRLAEAGRSVYVSGDLSAMVESCLAQMIPAFKTGQICEFDPLGPEDEDQAQLESDVVQHYVMGTENGFLALTTALKDILLHRNGVIMPKAVDRKQRRTQKFRNVQPEAYAQMVAEDSVVADEYDPDTGELTLTTEIETRSFELDCVSMRNFVYYSDWSKPTLEGIPVCAVRHVSSRAELVKLGYDRAKVDRCGMYQPGYKSEDLASKPKAYTKGRREAFDTSQELVEWYEIFVMEEAGDIDELRKIALCYQSRVILKDEPWPFINLASGVAVINPHEFTGISLYDKLKQIQDSRTGMKRALHDNINTVIQPGAAGLTGAVNEQDHADGRPNKMVRVDSAYVDDVRAAYQRFDQVDISANILANLQNTAAERTEMGGASLDMQSAQTQLGDVRGSEGVDRIYSVGEALTAFMLDVAASTLIRDLFLISHRVLREYFDEPLPFKRNGKWQYVNPAQWPERRACTIQPGMSPGERTRKINALTEVINSHLLLAERGMEGVLVDMDGFNKALLDRARLQEIQNPEQYYVDPQSEEARARMQSNAEQAQQDELQRASLMQVSLGMEQLREALDKYKHDTQLQFDYWKEVLGAEIEEAKIVGKVGEDIVKARGNVAEDVVDSELDGEASDE